VKYCLFQVFPCRWPSHLRAPSISRNVALLSIILKLHESATLAFPPSIVPLWLPGTFQRPTSPWMGAGTAGFIPIPPTLFQFDLSRGLRTGPQRGCGGGGGVVGVVFLGGWGGWKNNSSPGPGLVTFFSLSRPNFPPPTPEEILLRSFGSDLATASPPP